MYYLSRVFQLRSSPFIYLCFLIILNEASLFVLDGLYPLFACVLNFCANFPLILIIFVCAFPQYLSVSIYIYIYINLSTSLLMISLFLGIFTGMSARDSFGQLHV